MAAIGLVLVVAACSILPSASTPATGQAARERVVTDYLAALGDRDATAIAAMVSPRVNASVDIANAIRDYGGVRLRDVQVAWRSEVEWAYAVATVTGTANDGTACEIRVPMSWVDGAYYLALGEAPSTGGEASPESPVP
jgi:ketosteroid isomerase-like protein